MGASFDVGPHLVLSFCRPGSPRGALFSSSEVFLEGSGSLSESRVPCQGDCCPGLLKASRTTGTCYYLLGSQKWKKSSPEFRKLPASPSLHQSSKQQLLGFLQSSLDPVTASLKCQALGSAKEDGSGGRSWRVLPLGGLAPLCDQVGGGEGGGTQGIKTEKFHYYRVSIPVLD